MARKPPTNKGTMKTYIAVFTTAEEGGFVVQFPDLPGCITEGDSFQEAFEMANDVLAHWMADQKQDYEPTPYEVLESQTKEGEQLVAVKLDTKLMDSYSTTARINLSLPGNSLYKIDEYLSEKGGDRSKLMTAATLQYIEASR